MFTSRLVPPSANGDVLRRALFKASVIGGVAALTLPAMAKGSDVPEALAPMGETLAEAPLPIVDARFPAEMAPGVFVIPDRRIPLVPNIGIVVGRDAVLVIDSGLEPEGGVSLLKLARELAPGRKVILTLTHAHPEHIFGAQAFRPDVEIFYNKAQADYFGRSGRILLEGFRSVVLPPERKYLLDGVVLTPPDRVYSESESTLDLGGRTIRLETWGTAHSPGDQVVHLPDEQIIFTGDLIEERMFPIVPYFPPMIGMADIDVATWENALAKIVASQPRMLVPGHGNVGGPEIATNLIDYFKVARASTKAGVGIDNAADQTLRSKYPTWEHSQYIPAARRYFSRL